MSFAVRGVSGVQHEQVSNLIDSATPEQLRAIARLALRLVGHPANHITDGPHDGGADIVIENAAGGVLPIVVAVSVAKDWRSKLVDDVQKAQRQLGAERVLFISSRRIPEASFRRVQTKLYQSHNIHVDRLDQQSIADLVMDEAALSELLEIFGLPGDVDRPTQPLERRRDAIYAYAFFAPAVRSFVDAVRDRSLLIALDQAGGTARRVDLYIDASRLLDMSVSDAASLRGNLDRLLVQGRVHGRNGVVELAERERATLGALRALHQREESALREQLRTHIEAAALSPIDDVLTLLMKGLGMLLARHIGAPQALDSLHARARRLRRELEAYGLPVAAAGDRFVEQAIELARTSELGRSLAMGSVYQALTRFDRGALLRAFDAQSIALVLDASVAIPMLSALFHGSVEQRYFVVAEQLHRSCARAGIGLQLAEVWLEEMASHLLNAREYAGLVGDEDLRQSRNAYVAYFAAAHRAGRADDFATFLTEFGLTPAIDRRAAVDPVGARRELELFLRRQLAHYGVEVITTPADKRHLDRPEQDWAWACHDLGVEHREPILARHDRRVLAWLAATTEAEPMHAPLIVTWDRVLRHARPESAPGGALDPLAAVELLSFVTGAREPAMTARFAALQLAEAEAEQGSKILDELMRIERSNLSDAALD